LRPTQMILDGWKSSPMSILIWSVSAAEVVRSDVN
jgi:hypothetical protein